jgi:hypothetical protein
MSASRPSVKKYTSDANSGIGDLFGGPELPAGFRYVPDVLSSKEEKSLVQHFEKLPLKPFEFHGYQATVAYTHLVTDTYSRAKSPALTRAFPTTFGH